MENILYLFGGAVLGAAIYAGFKRKKSDSYEIKLLKKILSRLGDNPEDEKLKEEMMAKLNKLLADIKSTI